MGIDKSLTDDFPSVLINGVRYHYGRELTYGQYLVENAEYAKDYWCFAAKEDLLAFLVNLPESADREAFLASRPDWHEVSHEQRLAYMAERDAKLRTLMEEKQQAGTAAYFNVLCLDQAGYSSAYARPLRWSVCDDMEVEVRQQQVSDDGRREHLIELSAVSKDGQPAKGAFKINREQALKLASGLIDAARYVEDRVANDQRE
jgi:hypothetical protein